MTCNNYFNIHKHLHIKLFTLANNYKTLAYIVYKYSNRSRTYQVSRDISIFCFYGGITRVIYNVNPGGLDINSNQVVVFSMPYREHKLHYSKISIFIHFYVMYQKLK